MVGESCDSSSNTVLRPYPSLASGIVAKEPDVSAFRDDFRESPFSREPVDCSAL
jgi:hypothetical protein